MERFFSWHRIALALAVTALLSLQVHAQTKEQIKPDRIGYTWADKYSDEIYMLDVDVAKSTKEIKDAQVYLGEMVADPVVFLKEKATTDFKTVVKLANEKYAQGKAVTKTVDELFAGANFNDKMNVLIEQINQTADTKALATIGKSLKEALKNLGAVPKAADKLITRSKSIIAQTDGIMKQTDQLDMFKKASVAAALGARSSSLQETAKKIPALGDESVKTLGLYKKLMSNIKIK